MGVMRGLKKTCAMLVLAGSLAAVPAISSQGAGALDARQVQADSHLLQRANEAVSLKTAHLLAERQVVGLMHR